MLFLLEPNSQIEKFLTVASDLNGSRVTLEPESGGTRLDQEWNVRGK